ALEARATDNLRGMVDAAARAAKVAGTDATGAIDQVLDRLTKSVVGLINPVIDAAMAKTIRAIGMAANPPAMDLPGKLTGSLTGTQRLEVLSDHVTMFLNGFTFGTVESLSTESSRLAEKYGDATYWAAFTAGATTAVVVVVVGTVLTGGELPMMMLEG